MPDMKDKSYEKKFRTCSTTNLIILPKWTKNPTSEPKFPGLNLIFSSWKCGLYSVSLSTVVWEVMMMASELTENKGQNSTTLTNHSTQM